MQSGGLALCQELLQTCNRVRRRLLGRALSLQALATKVPADEVDVAVLAAGQAGQAGETGAAAIPGAGQAQSDVAWVVHMYQAVFCMLTLSLDVWALWADCDLRACGHQMSPMLIWCISALPDQQHCLQVALLLISLRQMAPPSSSALQSPFRAVTQQLRAWSLTSTRCWQSRQWQQRRLLPQQGRSPLLQAAHRRLQPGQELPASQVPLLSRRVQVERSVWSIAALTDCHRSLSLHAHRPAAAHAQLTCGKQWSSSLFSASSPFK